MSKKEKKKGKKPQYGDDVKRGLVIKATGKYYVVKIDDEKRKCVIRGKMRLQDIDSTSPVVVGDYVFVKLDQEKNACIIVDIDKRERCIIRRSQKWSKQKQFLACNIDQAILVVTLIMPKTPLEFIDRFLVAATAYDIPAKLVFNKIDLYSDELMEYLHELMDMYEKIGYETLAVSALKKINLDKFKQMLKDKISVLAGNSGVGKSSLINALDPNLKLKTREISHKYRTGRHTTTFAQMYELQFGGYIIDTPGIRGFGLSNLTKQDIAHNFPEMFKYLGKCKYYNCLHIDEPGCAVKEAVEKGEIPWTRYKSYLDIMLGDDSKYRLEP